MADLAEARRDTEFASSQARVLMQELDRLLGTLRNEVSIRALGTREQLERARCEVVIPIRDRVQATVEMHGKAMDRIDSTLDQVLGRLVVVAEKVKRLKVLLARLEKVALQVPLNTATA